MTLAYLVPAGRDRFELYSEAPEELTASPAERDGRFRQWMHRVGVKWHELVEQSRRGSARGRFARWRDALICRLAETIAEQRTLWSLRTETEAGLRFPSIIDATRARAILMRTLEDARTHHLRWFIIDGLLFVSSVVFFFIPGPNLVAYYFAFRFIGHLQSWRGARQGIEVVRWTLEPDEGLAELSSLVDLPREARAPRVAAIAERLNLRRLSAFFERVAVRST
jgi:hypothetical protein